MLFIIVLPYNDMWYHNGNGKYFYSVRESRDVTRLMNWEIGVCGASSFFLLSNIAVVSHSHDMTL